MFCFFARSPLAALLAAVVLGTAPLAQADLTDPCFNYLEAQGYPRALAEAQTLLKAKRLTREDERYAQLCLGRAHENTGRFREALPALLRVEALSQTSEELQTAYNWLGVVYESLGDLDRAELYDQRALKVAKDLGDNGKVASSLHNLALVVERRGDQERALALYNEALALEPDEARKAAKLNNIALIHLSRGEYDQAAQGLREALVIDRRHGDAHAAAMHQLNLGDTLRRQGDLDTADRELSAGLKAVQLLGDRGWEATANAYLAWLASNRKNKAAARDWYRKAEAIFREIGQVGKADQMKTEAAKLMNEGASK